MEAWNSIGIVSYPFDLERVSQHLYPLELQCDGKDNPVSVEVWSCKTDATSRSKRTAAVIVDIAIKDQVTEENDIQQVE